MEWPDFMERTERGVIFLLGLFISEITQMRLAGHDLFFWVLIALVAAVFGTVIQRVLRAKQYIEARG